jgi:hypothetical protein
LYGRLPTNNLDTFTLLDDPETTARPRPESITTFA